MKYSSVCLGFYFFYGFFIVLNKVLKVSYISPNYIFPLLIIFLLKKGIFYKKSIISFLFIILIIILNIIFSLDYISVYYFDLVEIIGFCLFPCLLSSSKFNFNFFIKVLNKMAMANIIIIIIYLILNKNDFLQQTEGTLTYMSIGYFLLPSILIGVYYSLFYKKNIFEYIFILIALFLNFLYGSRFSFILGYIGVLILLYLYNKKFLYYIFFNIAIIINFKKFLELLISSLDKLRINAINVERIYYSLYLSKDLNTSSAGRLEIYLDTLQIIKNNIFGIGIYGYLEKMPEYSFGFYPHNIFLEILLQFGIFGFIIFIFLTFFILVNIAKIKERKIKIFMIVLLILDSSLLISGSYLKNIYFWMTLFFIFNKSLKRIGDEKEKCYKI